MQARVWTFAGAARLGVRRLDAAFAQPDADKTITKFPIERLKVPDEFEVVWSPQGGLNSPIAVLGATSQCSGLTLPSHNRMEAFLEGVVRVAGKSIESGRYATPRHGWLKAASSRRTPRRAAPANSRNSPGREFLDGG